MFQFNWVHDNYGNGIWCDGTCSNVNYDSNTVINNAGWGIMFEIFTGAIIRKNVSNGNAKGQIFVSESSNVQIYGDNVRSSTSGAMGIFMQDQSRPGAPLLQTDSITGNTVTFQTAPSHTGGGLEGWREIGASAGRGMPAIGTRSGSRASPISISHGLGFAPGIGPTISRRAGKMPRARCKSGMAACLGVSKRIARARGCDPCWAVV